MTSRKSRSLPKPRGRRACSIALAMEIFLLVIGGTFVLQWWRWRAMDTQSDAATTPRAKLRGFDAFHPLGKDKQQYELLDPRMKASEKETSASPKAAKIPIKRQHPAVFVPPGPKDTRAAQNAWRARFSDRSNWTSDQQQVAKMVAWAWKGYEDNAFGQDYLDVVRMKGGGLPGRDMAITLVDSLDTLYLVGMFDEFDRASAWVATHMKARIWRRGSISLFETTIRILGGLLSAFYLSGKHHMMSGL